MAAPPSKPRARREHVPLYDESQVRLDPSAVVCQDAVFKGKVTIASGTVVHPLAQILAHQGEIIIGKDCIISENARIVNETNHTLEIGPCNQFESGATVRASVGKSNLFGARCQVASDVRLADHCVIGPGAMVSGDPFGGPDPLALPSLTVIYGAGSEQRKWDALQAAQAEQIRMKHLIYLREVLPKFARIRK